VLQASANSVSVRSLRIDGIGAAIDTDVVEVRMYVDVDGNGVPSGPDILLGRGPFTGGRIVFLLVTNLVFWFLGMVLEGVPAIILLTPITLPIATRLGIDPVHYGTMLIANQGIAVMTPPLGISLFVACSVGKVSIAGVSRTLIPYLLVMGLILLLITLVPGVSLVVPRLLGLH